MSGLANHNPYHNTQILSLVVFPAKILAMREKDVGLEMRMEEDSCIRAWLKLSQEQNP